MSADQPPKEWKARLPEYGTFTFRLQYVGTPNISLAVTQRWRGRFSGERTIDIPIATLLNALENLGLYDEGEDEGEY